MTAHEKPVGATVEWYTPAALFDALDVEFDLDPAAAPINWHVPAHFTFTEKDDGLRWQWTGRVWLNPPYGKALPAFVDRMCAHGYGLMLTPARTETRWWQKAADSADAVCFLRDRLHFVRADGFQARSSFGSTLFAWGQDCVYALARADLGHTETSYVSRKVVGL